MAGRIGITAKELSGLNLAFSLAGVPLDSMGSALGKTAEGDGRQQGVAALGVSVRSEMAACATPPTFSRTWPTSLPASRTAPENRAGHGHLRKSGADMVPLLNGGADGLREMVAQSERLGLVLDDETAAAAGKFNDTLEMIGLVPAA